jgi:hypothetical protein
MISLTLTTLVSLLSDYLKRSFRLNEDIVCLQPPVSADKSSPDNKIHLFLINIERETGAGIKFNQQKISDEHYQKGSPSLFLNIYLAIAAVFNEKQYEESLLLMSGIASFIQTNNLFFLPQTNMQISIEIENISFTEQSNIWSINGNKQYPAFICKLRNIVIDANEIKYIGKLINQKEVNL